MANRLKMTTTAIKKWKILFVQIRAKILFLWFILVTVRSISIFFSTPWLTFKTYPGGHSVSQVFFTWKVSCYITTCFLWVLFRRRNLAKDRSSNIVVPKEFQTRLICPKTLVRFWICIIFSLYNWSKKDFLLSPGSQIFTLLRQSEKNANLEPNWRADRNKP